MTGTDTIFALSSAPGRAGVAVVRISGPAAGATLRNLTGRAPLPPPRTACVRSLLDPGDGRALDRGLVLWFPGPRSFTGEDLAELQLHGGRAVVAAVLAALGGLPELRPAEPGEFTRRAFDAGKLDLSAVEGLADLINAETEAQRRQALRQTEGALRVRVEDWRGELLRVLAYSEAEIDFPDEDLPAEAFADRRARTHRVREEILAQLAAAPAAERLRDGFQVAIVGPPNAGKSSLLNALARRDVAIVSEMAGTTRDVIEVHLDLAGYPVTLADTAGLREALDHAGDAGDQEAIEREGMRRAAARAAAADLTLAVFDLSDEATPRDATLELLGDNGLVILNKLDRLAHDARSRVPREVPRKVGGHAAFALSARDGSGLAALLERLESDVVARLGAAEAAPAFTRLRHRRALEDCAAALDRAMSEGKAAELTAEDLRLALRALGRITGQVDVEDILDVIFRDFCIGK